MPTNQSVRASNRAGTPQMGKCPFRVVCKLYRIRCWFVRMHACIQLYIGLGHVFRMQSSERAQNRDPLPWQGRLSRGPSQVTLPTALLRSLLSHLRLPCVPMSQLPCLETSSDGPVSDGNRRGPGTRAIKVRYVGPSRLLGVSAQAPSGLGGTHTPASVWL